ncbi:MULTISPECIES: hypothetical protein [Actinoplanes]|uniref:hypothetical protein n=1 Tax=Actinoplanes TaxID=1865 RepID=UPI0005F2BE07|nr:MULTISPECIES: hypothetical protein [Actinoplanes]GLY06553.1 hypothetical protein Acsp01_69320 [Actinoplanes sp. NBRC 101535]
MTEVVQRHVRLLLEAPFRADAARRAYAEELIRSGRRVVTGGMVSATGWQLHDWLTGTPAASGDDGRAGLLAALAGAYHADGLFDDVPAPDPWTPGVPPSLSAAIEEWLFAPATPDQEIADFVGWPVGKVREHR